MKLILFITVVGLTTGWVALSKGCGLFPASACSYSYGSEPLNLKQAVGSQGLAIPCKVPYTLQYCATHPEAQ
jgi:hypothetical protein